MKAHIPINAKQRQEIQKIARETLNSEREKLYNAVNNEKDDIAKNLLCCISKDNLADFHNALVVFFGKENGKKPGIY